jgi:GT2 family glycosyltransferase
VLSWGHPMTMALTGIKRGKLKRKETRAAFHPRQVLDIELSEPLPSLGVDSRGRYSEALLLVRLHSYPIAQVLVSLEHSLTPEDLATELWGPLAPSINTFLKRHGLAPAASLADPQLEALGISLRAKREAFLSHAPLASIVICTRTHADNLERCLKSVLALEYPNYEIIVVECAPKNEAIKQVVEKFRATGASVHYAASSNNLSVARNTALNHVKGQFVAFLEDDDVPDKYWLLELAQGFERDKKVAAISGVVVPAELEFQAQVWGEELAASSEVCGFTPQRFNLATHEQSILLTAPLFGRGGNMAFRTSVLRKIGFDTTLETSTPALAEESAAFDMLIAGLTVVYEPSAIVRHYHPRDVVGLQLQLRAEGLGLVAFYVRCLRERPYLAPIVARLTPKILHAVFSSKRGLTKTLPKILKTAKRQGFVQGLMAHAQPLKKTAKAA